MCADAWDSRKGNSIKSIAKDVSAQHPQYAPDVSVCLSPDSTRSYESH